MGSVTGQRRTFQHRETRLAVTVVGVVAAATLAGLVVTLVVLWGKVAAAVTTAMPGG